MKRKEVLIAVVAGCFGAVITMGAGLFIPVGVVAQSQPTDAEFETITFGRLRVVDGKGNALVDLYNNGLGGSADFYDIKGDVMMSLKSVVAQSRIRLFHKKDFVDDSNRNPPLLGIDIDTNPLSSFLEVGNTFHGGAVRMHNADGFSELQVFHRNGEGGVVLFSSDNIHSLSVYEDAHAREDRSPSAKKVIGLGSYGGASSVNVYGKDKNLNASMTTTEHGGRVSVFSNEGQGSAAIGVNEYGNGAVSTWDQNGYR